MINKKEIEAQLLHSCHTLEVLSETDSTNQTIKAYPVSKLKPAVCIAERQRQGRGRHQKIWVSDIAGNLYFSFKYISKESLKALSLLSLKIGYWLLKLLEERFNCTGIKLKWPNDLYYKNKKLAGVLIETLTCNDELVVIIGIGLNLRSDSRAVAKDWVSLEEITSVAVKLESLIVPLIDLLIGKLLKEAPISSYEFRQQWQDYDYLKGKFCRMFSNNQQFIGKGCGISEDGGLILELESGQTQTFYSGVLDFER